jgi:hypothetical protein
MKMIKENFNKNLPFVPYGTDESDWKNFRDIEIGYASYVMPLGRKMVQKDYGSEFVLDINDKNQYHLYCVLSYAVYIPYETVAARNFIRLVSPSTLFASSELYSKQKHGSFDDFLENSDENVHIASAADFLKQYTETSGDSSIYPSILEEMVKQTEKIIKQYDAYYIVIDSGFYYSKNFSKIITVLGGHKESRDSQDVNNILKAIEGSEIKSWISPKSLSFYRVKEKAYDSWVKGKEELDKMF